MAKTSTTEKWKAVDLGSEHNGEFRLEVSNLGRLRSFNKINNGGILKGSSVAGYPVIKLKLYKKRDKSSEQKISALKVQVVKANAQLIALKDAKAKKTVIAEQSQKLSALKEKLSLTSAQDVASRVIYYHSLVHRLVATYFLPKPKANQTVVSHLDFNKKNNDATNLKWMTPEENNEHQQKSPAVKKDRKRRLGMRFDNANNVLNVKKVAQLKKQLATEQFTVSSLAQKYGISDMQVIRIRRGENWADVEAAK
ncbi:MAG: hypothetical protein RL660_2368 [Bacteroidota bacterium]|jgi:hypothetical protein